MPSYTYQEIEHHQMNRTYQYHFDTDSTEDWKALLELAASSGVDISECPSKPPEDLSAWIELIEELTLSDIVEFEDDVWTMDTGGYETSTALLDDDGNQVG